MSLHVLYNVFIAAANKRTHVLCALQQVQMNNVPSSNQYELCYSVHMLNNIAVYKTSYHFNPVFSQIGSTLAFLV